MIEVTRYKQDGVMYVCAGDADTATDAAREEAENELSEGEYLADDMERVDGCCTWMAVSIKEVTA